MLFFEGREKIPLLVRAGSAHLRAGDPAELSFLKSSGAPAAQASLEVLRVTKVYQGAKLCQGLVKKKIISLSKVPHQKRKHHTNVFV